MIYIVRKAGNGRGASAHEWHVNEPSPDKGKDDPWEDVCEVQADGHELDYIRRNLSGLPDKPNGRIVTWRGEWAQFVYDNALSRPGKYAY